MAVINRVELLEDIKMYMRADNVFSDVQINKISDKIITAVGDDDDNYSEVLCKSLRSIAVNNKAKTSDVGRHKIIRTEELHEEFYNGNSSNSWDEYLNSLDDVCASFGYTELEIYTTGFMHINPGDTIDVNPTDVTYASTGGL